MKTQKASGDYAELTSEIHALIVSAFGTGNRRALDFWKSVWDITSRPHGSIAIDSFARGNLERANKLTVLTLDELQSAESESTHFAEKLFFESTKAREMAVERFRELLHAYSINLPYIHETSSATFDALSSRLEELERRTALVETSTN